jgi:methyltransferase-like protein/2-polyprenyl-3-methyl-5-hydroxy-6-metoxy-1,4-benzoquinol methylase
VAAADFNSYDEVPYVRYTFAQTHPDRLATLARLFGMSPKPVQHCRVLELGCGYGDNVMAMATALPHSQFVGIDFSRRQIEGGRASLASLQLTNVDLRQANILNVDQGYGVFDYIIAHGVYSWIPRPVQEKLLTICSENLAPDGVALVSYNVLPGWHMHGMVRDMMRYHAARYADPNERIQQARALLLFLANSAADPGDPYGIHLRNEVKNLDRHTDEYLFHEYLEEVNDPVYFYQFLDQAAAKGLKYLGEADAYAMTSMGLPPEVDRVLARLSENWIQRQQYTDFVKNRQYRESLLCHDGIALDWARRFDHLDEFFLAGDIKPIQTPVDLHSLKREQFKGAGQDAITTDSPIVKAALVYLGEVWPRAVSFQEVEATAAARVHPSKTSPWQRAIDRDVLANALLDAFLAHRLVEWHLWSPPLVTAVSKRPLASKFARQQAVTANCVTNLRHEGISLNPFDRFVLLKLDGLHDRSALLAEMREPIRSGTFALADSPATTGNRPSIHDVVAWHLEESLRRIARWGLLLG